MKTIGLCYVGLALAMEVGKRFNTVGFDIDVERTDELEWGSDRTWETTREQLAEAIRLSFSAPSVTPLLTDTLELGRYDAIVQLVDPRQFAAFCEAGMRAFGRSCSVMYAIKCVLPEDAVERRV